MAKVNPEWFTALRRGAVGFGQALRPTLKPLAVGGGALLAFKGVESSFDAWGRQQNPPAQTIPIDTNPNLPGSESFAVFDPRTGRLVTYGTPPSDQGNGPERSWEREIKTGLWVAGAVALGITALVVLSKKVK